MSRAVDGTKRKNRRNKILKLAKGFRGDRKSNYKPAKDAVTKALDHAYVDRHDKKHEFQGITYSQFINGITKAGIKLNRKALSNMAIEDPAAFKAVVEAAKKAVKA